MNWNLKNSNSLKKLVKKVSFHYFYFNGKINFIESHQSLNSRYTPISIQG